MSPHLAFLPGSRTASKPSRLLHTGATGGRRQLDRQHHKCDTLAEIGLAERDHTQ